MIKELTGEERRAQLVSLVKNSDKPISGAALGKLTGVSRQIVVTDMALLRTQGYPIISTARGYVYSGPVGEVTREFKVCHTNTQVEDELQTIIDLGGSVIDVSVNHRTYGRVSASLDIKSRRDIAQFISQIDSSKSTLLLNVTSGYHFHNVSASSEEILDEIEAALNAKGYIAKLMSYEA